MRIMLACVFAVSLVAGPADAALAAPRTWTIQKSPDVTLPGGTFESVSCSSADACTAVGTHLTPSGLTATLAERWNGREWSRQALPNLPGVSSSAVPQLPSVSCPAARFCVAVGGTGPGSSTATTAVSLVWNGRKWKLAPLPLPAGSKEAAVSQVSCVSPTFCEAVGSRPVGTGQVTLAEVWRGRRWSPQRSPNPSARPADTFSGVSCSSAVFCEAAGYNVATDAVFAQRWNGRSWRSQSLPRSTGIGAVVSCASAKFCEAVGTGAAGWNGTSWRRQPLPKPPGASFIDLVGVSCASKSLCEAVGFTSNGLGAVGWQGNSWGPQPFPAPIAVPMARLAGVSCLGGNCEVVGEIAPPGKVRAVPLVMRWNGRSWLRQPAPAYSQATDNSLLAVSCASARFCAAVGSTVDGSGDRIALAQIWNGRSWAVSATKNPARADDGVRSELDAVSCVSATFCLAVGQSSANPGRGQTPGAGAQLWNGKRWQPVAVPGTFPLQSVSCVSARFCVAVGGVAETDQWNGHAWMARSSVPNLVLTSVSCVSAGFCEAIGSDASGTDAEAWNGTAWRPQSAPPLPPGASFIILNAVSCATRSFCVAVGNTPTDLATGVAATVVEVWRASTWAVASGAANHKATGSYLNGVSCTSPASCTAVGAYTFGTPPVPGAPLPVRTQSQVWNGTAWTLRTTPNSNPANDTLGSVSCRPGPACTAVGSSADPGGFSATLVETGD